MSKYQYETGLEGIRLISKAAYAALAPEENTLYIVKSDTGIGLFLGSLPLVGGGASLSAALLTLPPLTVAEAGKTGLLTETEETE